MSASPKSKRTPDEKRMLEDYVLTKETGPESGLYPINAGKLLYVPSTGEFTAGSGAYKEGATQGECTIPLGFTFRFDGLDYTRIHITLNGWVYLLQDSHVDPTSLSSYLEILGQRLIGPSALLPNPALPARIKSNFSQDYVLLAPWFSALRNCWRTTSGYINVTYNASKYLEGLGSSVSETVAGANPYPYGIDPDYGGVKFYRGNEARGGNFFLVRWKSFTTSLVYIAFGAPNFTRTAMFDLVLYESGHIEFRYAPRMIDLLSNLVYGETATVGIFASGPSFYNDRYRDCRPLIGPTDSRGIYKNGGAVYNNTAVDTDDTYGPIGYTVNNRYYGLSAVNLAASAVNVNEINWPGTEKSGATLRFSPPQIRRRQNKSVLNLRDSVSFAGSGSDSTLFDDQKTFSFTTQTVEYPSMMPTAYRVTNANSGRGSAVELYGSGSIQVERTLKPGLYEEVFRDAEIDAARRKK